HDTLVGTGDQERPVGQEPEPRRPVVELEHDVHITVEVDRQDAVRPDVGEPEPTVAPARALREAEPVEQHRRLARLDAHASGPKVTSAASSPTGSKTAATRRPTVTSSGATPTTLLISRGPASS